MSSIFTAHHQQHDTGIEQHEQESDELINENTDIDEFLPTTVRLLCTSILCFNTPSQRSHLRPVTSASAKSRRMLVQKKDWAHVINVNEPLKNFRELVPDMARKVSG
jgi:hypothetical protein